ncbi:M64 family metallopeptidase [Aquincola sp. MAHUQ-54]|uniref:M64 family metallopeptidase n=1 Tax=Aquincola agrisoli TaxID=3119538 RepID=A0AAW9Q354_9BURK
MAARAAMTALRLDLVHIGSQQAERYELLQFGSSAAADAHRRGHLDDRGTYRWTVTAPDGSVAASRGYSALFEEWQSTVAGDPQPREGRFNESHVVPWVAGGRLRIERREAGERFRTIFDTVLPDAGMPVPPAPWRSDRRLHELHGDGPVRLLMVAEGFAAGEEAAFLAAARRACEVLRATDPFSAFAGRLRFSALFVPSPASGIPTRPEDAGTTSFGSSYGALGMARYLVATDLHALGRATEGIAHAATIVLANAGTYGGSGIFNTNCLVPAGMDDADFGYVLPHELGHSLGGLGDEYFGKEVTYDTEGADAWQPWEPNVSPMDVQGRVKWSARVAAGVPVPTPWQHAEYLRLMQVPLLPSADPAARPPAEVRAELAAVMAQEPWAERIGVFEGARYLAHGLYRPESDCRMFTRSATRFCAICRETLAGVLAGASPDA